MPADKLVFSYKCMHQWLGLLLGKAGSDPNKCRSDLSDVKNASCLMNAHLRKQQVRRLLNNFTKVWSTDCSAQPRAAAVHNDLFLSHALSIILETPH